METPQQIIGRLLSALETLTDEEEHLFNTGMPAQSTAVQERAMPLVAKIASLIMQPGVTQSLAPALRERIQTLLNTRIAHYDCISAKIEATETELRKLTTASIRARQIRPVYCTTPATSPAMSFSGEG